MCNAAMNIHVHESWYPHFSGINIWYFKFYWLMPKCFLNGYTIYTPISSGRDVSAPHVLNQYGAYAMVSYLYFLHYI